MATAQKKTSWFAPKLRAELDQSKTSIRALARAWRPADAETARRSIIRYLQNGIVPNAATRAELAVALGISASELDPDDEEADQLMAPLLAAIRDLVRSEIRQAVGA